MQAMPMIAMSAVWAARSSIGQGLYFSISYLRIIDSASDHFAIWARSADRFNVGESQPIQCAAACRLQALDRQQKTSIAVEQFVIGDERWILARRVNHQPTRQRLEASGSQDF